jgi:hypothetical protein
MRGAQAQLEAAVNVRLRGELGLPLVLFESMTAIADAQRPWAIAALARLLPTCPLPMIPMVAMVPSLPCLAERW